MANKQKSAPMPQYKRQIIIYKALRTPTLPHFVAKMPFV
jgi:hypothetical protein